MIDPLGGPASESRRATGPAGNRGRAATDPAASAADPVTVASRALRRRRRSRRGWAFGAIAVAAVAGVIALALSWPAGPSRTGAAPGVTGTERLTPAGQAATLGRMPGTPSAHPGATGPAVSPGTQPGTPPGHTGTAQPSPGRTGVTASPTAPTSGPPATATPSPSATATPSVSPTVSPSSTGPADTPWQCGTVAAATLAKHGKATGQTLQACIRVHAGKLDLLGTLSGTNAKWSEQVILVLTDSAQDSDGSYTSPVCMTSVCNYTVSMVPASGEWTVLPEWSKSGAVQSAGNEPAYVRF